MIIYLFTGDDNPNLCSDPMKMTSLTLGSNDNFYNYILGIVNKGYDKCKDSLDENGNPVHSYGGAVITDQRDGIKEILNTQGINYTVNVKSSSNGAISSTGIISEIDNERPVIIRLGGELGGTSDKKSGHFVVAYGYREYTYADGSGKYSGYATHYGWSDDSYPRGINAWVNSAWCSHYLTLNINHTHNYDKYLGGSYCEEKCSTCGHRRYAYITSELSKTEVEITGCTHDVAGNIIIPNRINGLLVRKIGDYAFAEKNELRTVSFPESLLYIGEQAFLQCINLHQAFLPENLISIGMNAFALCESLDFNLIINRNLEIIGDNAYGGSSIAKIDTTKSKYLKTIGAAAFSGCQKIVNVSIPDTVETIGTMAFSYCTALEHVNMKNVQTIGYKAFNGCDNLTIYTTKSNAAGWNANWNNSNRPVIWETTIPVSTVHKFGKTPNNPSTVNNIKNPVDNDFNFIGWYTTSDYSGDKYATIPEAPDGILYAKWETKSSDSCVASGTLITLSDGSQKAVADLTGEESLLVWNMYTGTFDTAPILFMDSDPMREYEIIKLWFSDGTEVKVISEHGFWNIDRNE